MRYPKITVAPNGARRQKSDHPELPITIAQTAQTARACFDEGAHEIHLHIRTATGAHSLDPMKYQEAIAAVQEIAPGMDIQVTTESAGIFEVQDQLDCLEKLRPDAASVAVREMARNPKLAAKLYAQCLEADTKLQHILYTDTCVNQLNTWFENGTVPAQFRDVIFVLGQYAPPVLAQPADLHPFLESTKHHNLNWTVCAFGQHEHACLIEAARLGGDVRVGFENNIQFPSGAPLKDNATSVAKLVTAMNKTMNG